MSDKSINAGLDRLHVAKDQPAPELVPGGVDVIADLAGRIASGGVRCMPVALDDRTAAIVDLLMTRCCPVEGRARVAWLCGELSERRRIGTSRYGTPLQAGNGRDPEVDLLQELLDAAAYSHQAAIEGGRT